MQKILNSNQGLLTLLSIGLSLIVYIFSDYKIGALVFGALCLIIFLISKRRKPVLTPDEVKQIAKILFVDDKNCPIAINLIRNGFGVKEIKDVIIVADQDVQWANIVFVDNKGVGKKLVGKKEGLGLIKLLKKTYGSKKRFIIYSSEQDFDGVVDIPYIRKNASYDEFMALISEEISNL